jgi:glucose-6-phosphate isomerase
MSTNACWEHFKKSVCVCPEIGLMLDYSKTNFSDTFFSTTETAMQRAADAMDKLEAGAIANPDEKRMVGHYWLRDADRAPSEDLRKEIRDTWHAIKTFSADVHAGKIKPQKAARFTKLLCIGIGGSALGPQFVADALGTQANKLKPYFLDNTDPDGFDRVIAELGSNLQETLTIVISKSGGTIETRNGMIEVANAYKNAGLSFEKHAVAVTGEGSKLYDTAKKGGWLAIFPMWDWVGGRTSITSAVGLLPMALQGIDIDAFLAGASACDALTRRKETKANPAALLALSWFHSSQGRGTKDMVILPYKDRLMLFPKYLQQLVMESLGKEKDLDNKIVNQGLTVYGNKGATDQHAYVQQLRDGVHNFFVTFIEVLKDRTNSSPEVDPGVTSGDYLNAFMLGTRSALAEKGRESTTLTVNELDARTIGALIALYERTVGLYAILVNVNAYHQPGVEAGKKMASSVIELQRSVLAALREKKGVACTVEALATQLNAPDRAETIFKILEHVSANNAHRVAKQPGGTYRAE